jgi:hypothetical protein
MNEPTPSIGLLSHFDQEVEKVVMEIVPLPSSTLPTQDSNSSFSFEFHPNEIFDLDFDEEIEWMLDEIIPLAFAGFLGSLLISLS